MSFQKKPKDVLEFESAMRRAKARDEGYRLVERVMVETRQRIEDARRRRVLCRDNRGVGYLRRPL